MRKMSQLFRLIEEVQYGDEPSLVKFIHQLEPKVNRLLRQTHHNNREDLRQELFLMIILTTKKYKLGEVPDFEEFHRKMM